MAMRTQIRSKSHRRRIGGSYVDTVLKTGPIAYWPLDESAGTAARCLVNSAQNGTAVGVTWADDRGPFDTPAPFFDGTNDYINIYSAALDAAFNGATGSMVVWCRVNGAGVWTDGAIRYVARFRVDGDNQFLEQKAAANNQLVGHGEAGNGTAQIVAVMSSVAWFHFAITWSDSNNDDEFKYYIDGTQEGATSNALNAWAGGALAIAQIGASAAATNVWHGWLAHCAVWDRVLTQAEITALANP